MVNGTIKWQIPLGTTPYVPMKLGMPGLGGPIVTGGGVIFIAASFDDRMRAFATDGDSTRGDYLIAYALPQ